MEDDGGEEGVTNLFLTAAFLTTYAHIHWVGLSSIVSHYRCLIRGLSVRNVNRLPQPCPAWYMYSTLTVGIMQKEIPDYDRNGQL